MTVINSGLKGLIKVRIIAKSSFYTHSDPIFIKFNILKVSDKHLHQQLKLYIKLINNILLDHFYDFNLALNSDLARGINKLRNARLKHEFARNFIRNQMPHLLNTTHLSILEKVLTHSLKVGHGLEPPTMSPPPPHPPPPHLTHTNFFSNLDMSKI